MATIVSLQSGNWEDTTTWTGGVVPVDGDKAQINSGHVVTINGDVEVGDDSSTALYVNNGTLKFNRSADITLQVRGRIQVDNDGIWDMGTQSDPCLGTIRVEMNRGDVVDYGALFYQGAHVYMYGKERTTHTELLNTSLSSSSTIDVVDATGWEVGDEIIIVDISGHYTPVEVNITSITSITGGYQIGIDTPLSKAVYAEAPVGNKTKNLIFTKHPSSSTKTIVRMAASFTTSAIYNVQHVQFHNLRGNTSTYQGGLNFSGANGNSDFIFNHISITGDSGTARGIDVNNYRDSTGTYSNFLMAISGGDYFMRLRSGATLEFTNLITYKGQQMSSSWSQGSSGMTFTNCEFYHRNAEGSWSISGVTVTFNNCFFGSSNDQIRALYITDVGLLTLNNCEFGRISGDWNIGYYKVIDSAGSGFQENVECDSNDYSAISNADAVTIDFDGSSTLEYASLSSYVNDINFDNTGLNRVYKPTGLKIQTTDDFVLGTHSIRFYENNNTSAFTQSYKVKIPTGINCVLSGFYKVISPYSGSSKPIITITSDSGVNENLELTGTEDIWNSFEIPFSQSSGSDEFVTITYSTNTTNVDESYLDSLMITSYGFTNVESRSPAVTNLTSTLIGELVSNALVTQDESTASSHTGISITESPVTWNSKDFEITITGNLTTNPSLTLEDIQHYLYYNFNKIAAFEGRGSGFLWEDILPLGDDETKTFNSKGVRIIDENGDAFPGVTRMQSNDGSYYIAPIKYNLQMPNIINGSRVRIFNKNTSTELTNKIISGGAGVNEFFILGSDYSAGDVGEYTITYQSGTLAKQYLKGEFTFSGDNSTNILPISQSDDLVYNSNGIDGSLATEFSADFPNIQVDINDLDGTTTIQRLYAWFVYQTTTSSGIEWVGGLIAQDTVNYIIITSILDLLIENTGSNPVILTGANLSRDDNLVIFATTGSSLFLQPDKAYLANSDILNRNILNTQALIISKK
jgi:hypothetical protein